MGKYIIKSSYLSVLAITDKFLFKMKCYIDGDKNMKTLDKNEGGKKAE